MKLTSIALLAACVPAVVTDAKLRGKFKKNKKTDLKMKMTTESPSSSPSSSPDADEPTLKRKLTEKTLRIAGLGPEDKLTNAEMLYLEDLVKKNLNKQHAEDPFAPEGHHALILTDVIDNDRRLFGSIGSYEQFFGEEFQDDDDGFDLGWNPYTTTFDDSIGDDVFEDPVYANIDVKVWDEYICKYCPDDEDDWLGDPRKIVPTPAPTPAPTPGPTPTPAPTVDVKPALKEAIEDLCKGIADSPFFRLRNVHYCAFV